MRTLAVFDIDGVLVDSKSAVYKAYAECLHISESKFEELIWGRPWNEAASLLGLTEAQALEVHDKKNHVFPKYGNLIQVDASAVCLLEGFINSPRFDILLATGGSLEATLIKKRFLPPRANRLRVLTKLNKRNRGFWVGLLQEYPDRELLVVEDDAVTVRLVREMGGTAILWTR